MAAGKVDLGDTGSGAIKNKNLGKEIGEHIRRRATKCNELCDLVRTKFCHFSSITKVLTWVRPIYSANP